MCRHLSVTAPGVVILACGLLALRQAPMTFGRGILPSRIFCKKFKQTERVWSFFFLRAKCKWCSLSIGTASACHDRGWPWFDIVKMTEEKAMYLEA